jgi:glutamate dehydrogenase/leucine dehydrogenase
VQNRKAEQWSVDKVNAELEKYLKKAVEQMYKSSTEQNVPLKEAAIMTALKNLV